MEFKNHRQRLLQYLTDNPMSILELARRIGVSSPTLYSRIARDAVSGYKIGAKIENFLRQYESTNKDNNESQTNRQ